jgi:hypothetical protein
MMMTDSGRFVWSRLRLAIERVSDALDLADSGHIITSDNVRISDVRMLLGAANALAAEAAEPTTQKGSVNP